MNYKTHLAGGILAGIATMSPISEVLQIGVEPMTTVGAIYMVSSMAGSLFPDLDHRGSYLSKKMKITSMVMSNMFAHRGITHSPMLLTIGTFSFYFLSTFFYVGNINLVIGAAFLMGALSHVFLDWFTKAGVPMLMPFSKEKHSLLKMKSGRIGEKLVFVVCIALASYLLMNHIDLSMF